MGATAARRRCGARRGREPRRSRAARRPRRAAEAPTADAVIVLWMAGGMAQTETFDPEALHAVRAGRARSTRCSARSRRIDTAVDQHQVHARASSRSRSVIDRGTVIRTFKAADLGFILHSRHQYHWHTGYIPPQPMAMPHIGAVISKTLGPKNPDMPAFIAIGQTIEGAGEIGTLKAFHTAGFLGTEHGPFLIVDPQDAASAVRPPKELGEARFRSRRAAVREAARAGAGLPVRQRLPARVAACKSLDAADRLLRSPSAKAFDLVARAEGERSTPTTPAASARAACWRGG